MAVGLTFVEPLAAGEVNVPGVMVTVVAPVAAQLNVLLVLEFMAEGAAVKDVMSGTEPLLVEDFGKVAPVQPASAAQARKIRASAQEFNLEEFSWRELDSFPQVKLGKLMRNSFLQGTKPV